MTPEEVACEAFFKENCSRGSDGRYKVALPFKPKILDNSPPKFCHTHYCALKRLKQVKSKFVNNSTYASKYRKFMAEYESLGHMTKIGTYPEAIEPNGCFLPHHGLIRESSSTTKLRVVFDGSCKRPPYTLLNDELCPGPALQNYLPAIINLWRSSDSDISVYKLRTVTYGTSSAPYLSIRVLQQLAHDENETYPEACNILMTDTYVGGIIS
ncbi:uncharacterized protein [Musca autumnalis]|uniref:uncharacterized protein n=1 Tax=Musca autumnalis TaxID=221902 RepID=UPI003CF0DBC6